MHIAGTRSAASQRSSDRKSFRPFFKAILLTIVGIISAATVPSASATVLADWTFESSRPGSSGNFPADLGVYSSTSFASGSHVSTSTVYSSPVGNGSISSFDSNMWAIGDYYQLQSSTMNFDLTTVTWDQTSGNMGPQNFLLQYGTDGTNFTDYTGAYTTGAAADGITTVLANGTPNPSWNSFSFNPAYSFGVDLSAISALSNASTVCFRLVDQTTTSAAGSTVTTGALDRIDNFTINATPIPEPTTFSVLAVFSTAILLRRRPTAPQSNTTTPQTTSN